MKYILGSSVTLLSVIAIRLPSFDEVNTERVRECLQNYVRASYKSLAWRLLQQLCGVSSVSVRAQRK
jgi:hypothetical protein